MKWNNLYSAVLAMSGLMGTAFAGTCAPASLGGHGADKSTGCAPAYQPCASKPTICRPNHRNACTYQRSCTKQACGTCGPNSGIGNGGIGNGGHGAGTGAGCAPRAVAAANSCAPAASNGSCGTNASTAACSTKSCGGVKGLFGKLFGGCGKSCSTGCAPAAKGCAPAAVAAAGCAAPAGRGGNGCAPAAAAAADPGCAAPRASCAPAPKAERCCPNNTAEVAHLIHESQTACYAKQRRRAIIRLGRLDCACNPEIMHAFAYALNDCDERVRHEAADQIRKQTRKNSCCCQAEVVAALTCALADCDRGVRRAAEKALQSCGYEVKNCNESKCAPAAKTCAPSLAGHKGCAPAAVAANKGCAPAAAGAAGCAPSAQALAPAAPAASTYAPVTTEPAPVAPVPAIDDNVAPAPIPEAGEPAAYFPSRLNKTQTKTKKSGLSNLFGLRG